MNPIVFAVRRHVMSLMLVMSLISGGVLACGNMKDTGSTLTIRGSTQLRGVLLARVHLSEADGLPEKRNVDKPRKDSSDS